VGYYPLTLSAPGALLRAEFAAIGADALAQLAWGASADGPWAVVPAAALSPAVAAAEDAYQERRSAEEAGWSTWDADDMLSSVLLPAGLALPLAFLESRAPRAIFLHAGKMEGSLAASLKPCTSLSPNQVAVVSSTATAACASPVEAAAAAIAPRPQQDVFRARISDCGTALDADVRPLGRRNSSRRVSWETGGLREK
jgi:hypothetical protein